MNSCVSMLLFKFVCMHYPISLIYQCTFNLFIGMVNMIRENISRTEWVAYLHYRLIANIDSHDRIQYYHNVKFLQLKREDDVEINKKIVYFHHGYRSLSNSGSLKPKKRTCRTANTDDRWLTCSFAKVAYIVEWRGLSPRSYYLDTYYLCG